jgi:hypothetical protein
MLGLVSLIDYEFILAELRVSHDQHAFKLIVLILLQIVLIHETAQVTLWIDHQIAWFFSEASEVILDQFVYCGVEFFLVHN